MSTHPSTPNNMPDNIRNDVQNVGRRANQEARHVASNHWMTVLARFGYAARGIVYLVIGVLAVELAVGVGGGSATDQRGALQRISEQPFGKFLLAIIAIGLFGFALWSLLQAWFDTENQGTHAKGIIARLGYVVTGLSYGLLAVGALQLATGSGGTGRSTTTTAQDTTTQLLKQPFGVALVVLLGLVIIGLGGFLVYKGYSAQFKRRLNLATVTPQIRRTMIFLGQFGYIALGVVFLIIGVFLNIAAAQHDPHKAKGLDTALLELSHQPYGPFLLCVVALGLIAYGVFSFVEARYRRVGV